MTLPDWLNNRWLAEHDSSREEISDLFDVVDRDLKDASVRSISPDWRMGIAYNAALQLAMLALAAEGYRPERQRAHERAILSLRLTVGSEQSAVDTLDGVRRKRNVSNYERAGTTSHREADEVLAIGQGLRDRVRDWLEQAHPNLL